MTVNMGKITDGTTGIGAGVGAGLPPVETIAGRPVRKGAEIALTGARIGGRRVDAVLIEPIGKHVAQAVLMGPDGRECPVGKWGGPAELFGMWLRFSLSAGVYAGVVRMR